MMTEQRALAQISDTQMMASNHGRIDVPKLTGKNYLNWRSIMSDIITLRGYEGVISGEVRDSTLNLHAKLLIKSTLDDTHLAEERHYDLAHEMWNHLSRMCIGANSSNVAMLVRKFYSYQFVPGDSMGTHLEKLSTMREQLKDVSQGPTDEVFIDRILQTLPSEFKKLKENWDYMHRSEKTVSELKARILAIEEKNKHYQPQDDQQVFMMNKQTGRFNKESIEDRKKRTHCGKCGHKGHWVAECHTKPQNYRNNIAEDKQAQNNFESSGQNDLVFMTSAIVTYNSNEPYQLTEILKNQRIADSEATSHICNNKAWFKSFKPYASPQHMKVGDDSETQIIDVGEVYVTCNTGRDKLTTTVSNILLAPQIATNILSIGELASKGINAYFNQNGVDSLKNNSKVAYGTKLNNNLYLMDIRATQADEKAAYFCQAKRSLEEWHRTLGHASNDRINKLISDKEIGISASPSDKFDCTDCPAGKGKHVSHPTKDRRVTQIGERVFIDLSGPIMASHQGSKYFMLSKDEFSTYTHIYCLKEKIHTDLAIRQLCTDFELNTGERIKRLHSDQGSEFFNQKTELIMALEHISHESSAAFTPQQNGTIEREIQSVTQMARTMLLSSGLPNILWDEAVKTAVFIRNRLPNKIVKSTPYEEATKRKPKLTHLCIFGREVHVLSEWKYLHKFDARTEMGYVVGFTQRSNTYRVYISSRKDKKVLESCNIIFKPHKQPISQPVATPIPANQTNPTPVFINKNTPSEDPPMNLQREPPPNGGVDESLAYYDSISCGNTPAKSFQTYQRVVDDITDEDVPSPSFSTLTAENDSRVGDFEFSHGSINTNTQTQNQSHRTNICMAMFDDQQPLEPKSYKQAISCKQADQWLPAIEEEFQAHAKNGTWQVVDRPSDSSLMSTKWVFKVKTRIDGSIERFKARLVARGFEQKHGVDFF